jgi:uracil-DNA glycosylase
VADRLQADLAAGTAVFPPEPLRALRLTAPEDVRVVILGQDPYHGPGQAYGLAFAVPPGVRMPPSLRNIYKELQRDFGRAPQPNGLLEHWARQGVLLLNTSLTVASGQAGSHGKIGWQALTGAVFQRLVESKRPLAFMLWGGHAQAMRPQTDTAKAASVAFGQPPVAAVGAAPAGAFHRLRALWPGQRLLASARRSAHRLAGRSAARRPYTTCRPRSIGGIIRGSLPERWPSG